MKPIWIVAFTVAIASTAPLVFAQSIADVARQEEARRAKVRKPSKVFTNASLSPTDQPSGRGEAPVPPSVAAAPATPGNSSATTTEAAAVEAPVVLDEKQWRGQAALLRARITAARKALAELDGASHADPREQAMLQSVRKRRQAALAEAEEAQRRFELQADANQVPMGWLQDPGE